MLIVVGGPMFAGKTTWLLDYTKTLPQGSFAVFKPSIDTRYAKQAIASHNGQTFPAINLDIQTPVFPDLPPLVTTLLIDELNFFAPEALLPALTSQLALGRTIVGVGLVYDFLKKPFGATHTLAKIADRFVRLYATCDHCGKRANHSYRKVHAASQVLLGASETYGPCCTSCWNSLQTPPVS